MVGLCNWLTNVSIATGNACLKLARGKTMALPSPLEGSPSFNFRRWRL